MFLKPVRVILFYRDYEGREIVSTDYPDKFEFPKLVFAEQVTGALIAAKLFEALGDIQFPDRTDVSWTAIEGIPENKVH